MMWLRLSKEFSEVARLQTESHMVWAAAAL